MRPAGGIARTVGVLGLSFKADTDDIRDSPALPIVEKLLAGGAQVRAFDPAAMDACREVLPKAVVYCKDEFEAADGADCLLILTEWNQFRALELDRMRKLLKQPVIIDLRNLYQPKKMAKAGFHYISVGRPDGVPANS